MSTDHTMRIQQAGWKLAMRHAEISALHLRVRVYANQVLLARKLSAFNNMFAACLPDDILALIAEHARRSLHRSGTSEKWPKMVQALTSQHTEAKHAQISSGCYFEDKFRELIRLDFLRRNPL